MFIQPCFINKNTPELRQKLKELGYQQFYSFKNNSPFIWIFDNQYFSSSNIGLFNYSLGDNHYFHGICCKDNIDLFLAIAALRDDSDKYQWFVRESPLSIVNYGIYAPVGSMTQCLVDKWFGEDHHKATVEELIEYFKE